MAIVQPTDVMSVADAVSGARAAPVAERASAQPVAATQSVSFALAAGQRELRLDLFRGLALWLIYIDHVSPDLLTWFTIRNYGFSDAAEIFIFISGFTAALVYGRATFEKGFVIGTARIARRVWQIYTTHLLLFLLLMAEIAFVTAYSGKQFYEHEMVVEDFFRQPGADMIQALFLRFRPLNMDVLPLYVVLMGSAAVRAAAGEMEARPAAVLSIALYIVANRLDLHLSTYPDGFWSFNPFGWQLLVRVRRLVRAGRREAPAADPRFARSSFWLAVAYLCAAFALTMTWYFPQLESFVPGWLSYWIYPINKTDFDILRFAHFLALAVVGLHFVPANWAGLRSAWAQPLILCGQYSLQIFALGVALSFAGYALLMELDAGVALHFIVGAAGHPDPLWRGANVHLVQARHGGPGARQDSGDVCDCTDIRKFMSLLTDWID